MFIKSQHSIEEVLSWMEENNEYGIFHGVKIHLSIRMRLFTKSQTCVSCGVKGAFFRLESHHEGEKPHLNLYTTEKKTKRGEFVLMTKDHIIPRSKGGRDEMENLQVMCDQCNVKKGSNSKDSLTNIETVSKPEVINDPDKKDTSLHIGHIM